jgi:hypothetical protein
MRDTGRACPAYVCKAISDALGEKHSVSVINFGNIISKETMKCAME